MDDITIISYPSSINTSLLSLTESRSRYMLPFGGRFRIVDFTINNSLTAGARKTIIYNNCEDDLDDYVEKYGPFKTMNFPPIKVVSREYSDIGFCYNLILDCNTSYYIIYNGDNPSLIDFSKIVKSYRNKKAAAVLYKVKVSGRATMAHTILVINQKTLLKIINLAIDEKRESPNLFEMIINIVTNRGIINESLNAYYWPIKNIPDYYSINMKIMEDPKLSSLLLKESLIKNYITDKGMARIGENAKITNSFISDNCQVYGTVENSIIFPGVEIGENTIIKNSIILPFIKIGSRSRIERTLIDERTDFNAENNYLNIGNNCHIGKRDEQLKNNDFPRSVFRSITLIGKDCHIPEGSRIGGACYIASGKGEEHFLKRKYLYDGLSLIK